MRAVQNEIQRIVEDIKTYLKLDNITFYYSTPTEFIEHLTKLGNKQHRKYPFFFVNSMNVHYNETNRICYVDDIVIATWSKSEWKADEREEKSMPIIKSIHKEFVRRTKFDKYVKLYKEGEVYPHYFYGKTGIVGYESGIFPDHVDAIQLKSNEFRLKKECI